MTPSSAQPGADPAPALPRVSSGSTLLPLMALGILVLMLMARAAFEYQVPAPAAEVEPPREVQTSATL